MPVTFLKGKNELLCCLKKMVFTKGMHKNCEVDSKADCSVLISVLEYYLNSKLDTP